MDEELLTKLKREFPEIEEGVLLEALRNSDYDYRRAAESVRVRRTVHRAPAYNQIYSLAHPFAGKVL